jgi:hypothetical protein
MQVVLVGIGEAGTAQITTAKAEVQLGSAHLWADISSRCCHLHDLRVGEWHNVCLNPERELGRVVAQSCEGSAPPVLLKWSGVPTMPVALLLRNRRLRRGGEEPIFRAPLVHNGAYIVPVSLMRSTNHCLSPSVRTRTSCLRIGTR